MNLKSCRLTLAVWLMISSFLSFCGCHMPISHEDNAKSPITTAARTILSRGHNELHDPQDNLFVTYWERNYYRGTASMNVFNGGYTSDIDYSYVGNDGDHRCIVLGKGIKPCNGETISWNGTNEIDRNEKGEQIVGASFFGVYGWLRDPLVEYYIGELPVKKEFYVETYKTDQGEYDFYVLKQNRENIIHPETGSEFLQFICIGPNSPVNMTQHYVAWNKIMKNYVPAKGWEGWEKWHNIKTPDYCVVATELYDKRKAHTEVSDITISNKLKGNCKIKYDINDSCLYATSSGNYPAVAAQSLDRSWGSQKWTIEDLGDGYSRIKNDWSQWYLTCNAAKNTSEKYAEAFCQPRTDTDMQKWKIIKTGDLVYVQHSSGLYLTIYRGWLQGSAIVCQPFNPDWISQKWRIDTSDNTWRLKSNWEGRYLTCIGINDGDAVKGQKDYDWDSEKWSCEPIEDGTGYVRFINKNSGKYLTAFSQADGSPVVTKPVDMTGDSQKWVIEGGTFTNTCRLRSVSSGNYLTYKNGSQYLDLYLKPLSSGDRDVSQIWKLEYFW